MRRTVARLLRAATRRYGKDKQTKNQSIFDLTCRFHRLSRCNERPLQNIASLNDFKYIESFDVMSQSKLGMCQAHCHLKFAIRRATIVTVVYHFLFDREKLIQASRTN